MFHEYNPKMPFEWRTLNKRIVVSSDCRKLGKTLIIENLVSIFAVSGYKVTCVKLSHNGHGPEGVTDSIGPSGTDTNRFSAAGASEYVFCKYSTLDELTSIIGEFSFDADIIIYESNTVNKLFHPDFHIHISSDSEQKLSAEGLELIADITFEGPVSPEKARSMAQLAAGLIGIGDISPITIGGKHWLNIHGVPLFGEGRMDLLKAVNETGSILQAAKRTGIQYKRAWVLLHNAEKRLGAKLLHSGRGGTGGGGTSITPLAVTFLAMWEKSGKDFEKMLKKLEV